MVIQVYALIIWTKHDCFAGIYICGIRSNVTSYFQLRSAESYDITHSEHLSSNFLCVDCSTHLFWKWWAIHLRYFFTTKKNTLQNWLTTKTCCNCSLQGSGGQREFALTFMSLQQQKLNISACPSEAKLKFIVFPSQVTAEKF